MSIVGAFTHYPNPLKAVQARPSPRALNGKAQLTYLAQLLWVNLIMDTFGALALGTEVQSRCLRACSARHHPRRRSPRPTCWSAAPTRATRRSCPGYAYRALCLDTHPTRAALVV